MSDNPLFAYIKYTAIPSSSFLAKAKKNQRIRNFICYLVPKSMESDKEYTLKSTNPLPSEYVRIRYECGFGKVSIKQAQDSLANSIYCVSIYDSQKLIGLGRIIGDGVLFFSVSDVLVDPSMRGRGLGKMIMTKLVSYLEETANSLSTISLLAAPGRESFYTKFGFELCPNRFFGNSLCYLKLVEK